ncbi:MAG: dTDP-4-dehydrorhamnose 3,5-epimerase family protein [Acidimicrobiaceae bacterium]|nr:dTDP-4-dehydrorhamnose 3,5-epimerase family protein [Acidimicrobiaceae bacterium]
MAQIDPVAAIEDVLVVRPQVFADPRGRFVETYRRSWFPLGREMVQGSRSDKEAGSLVGLHYHLHQADYWYVPSGRARVVLFDLRVGSATFLNSFSIEIGDSNEVGIFIPPGVAHGFAAITDMMLTYLVDGYYNPSDELGIKFDDPAIGADWGVADPVISERDRSNPMLADVPEHLLPRVTMRT